MAAKFKGRFRIESTRLQSWDYGSNVAYFITICTHGRRHFFGRITNGKMQLNEIGKIADECWLEIPEHFPFVILGNHVIMPNHVHGIVMIDKPAYPPTVETQNFASLPSSPSSPQNRFGPQSKNLASIIRGFKIGVTKNARIIDPDFSWQSRYHDHIIRNEPSFHRISQYIINNAANWAEDRLM